MTKVSVQRSYFYDTYKLRTLDTQLPHKLIRRLCIGLLLKKQLDVKLPVLFPSPLLSGYLLNLLLSNLKIELVVEFPL